MQTAVRDLISGMFNDNTSQASTSHGKGLATDCQEIVKAYVVSDTKQSGHWYEKILSVTGGGGNTYSHASNVATIAALFSMGTGVGKPEEPAMAGILHDIGITDLPAEIQLKPKENLTPEELKVYQTHVELSMKIIRDRKLIVPEIILKMIEMHHERLDGSGYPRAVTGKKFIPEAQLLALADQFDHLTAVKEGQPTLTPQQAIQKLKLDCFKNPGMPLYDPEIFNKLAALFAHA
jgi:HD-GYP domain-containing protein (c-di-GMP phosphodiesterase class II)